MTSSSDPLQSGVTGLQDSNQDDGGSDSNTSNDWGAFILGCLMHLVTVIMMGMIGANFIFYATLPQGTTDVPGPDLNDFFPSYVTQYLEFDKPCGPLPQEINDASLNTSSASENLSERIGDCFEAAKTSLYPEGEQKSSGTGKDPGLVSSNILAQGGWSAYFRVKAEYKLAARRIQRNIKTLLNNRFREKNVGGKDNPNHISPEDLLAGLKEEQLHFMKEEDEGRVGIDPNTDRPRPLPAFKNPAVGSILSGINEIVEASKFQPLYDPKIEADFKFKGTDTSSMNLNAVAGATGASTGLQRGGAILSKTKTPTTGPHNTFASGMGSGMNMMGVGMGMGMGMGTGMTGSVSATANAATNLASKKQKIEARNKANKIAMRHMAQRQTLIIKLQDILSDSIAMGGEGDIAGAVAVLLSKELVEVSIEELSSWKTCLQGWEDRAKRLCPYFVEPGGGQCSCETRNTFKNVNLLSGQPPPAIQAAAKAQNEAKAASAARAAARAKKFKDFKEKRKAKKAAKAKAKDDQQKECADLKDETNCDANTKCKWDKTKSECGRKLGAFEAASMAASKKAAAAKKAVSDTASKATSAAQKKATKAVSDVKAKTSKAVSDVKAKTSKALADKKQNRQKNKQDRQKADRRLACSKIKDEAECNKDLQCKFIVGPLREDEHHCQPKEHEEYTQAVQNKAAADAEKAAAAAAKKKQEKLEAAAKQRAERKEQTEAFKKKLRDKKAAVQKRVADTADAVKERAQEEVAKRGAAAKAKATALGEKTMQGAKNMANTAVSGAKAAATATGQAVANTASGAKQVATATGKKVVSGAKAAATATGQAVVSGARQAVSGATATVQGATAAAKDMANTAGQKVVSGARQAGQAVANTAATAGQAVANTASATKEKVVSGARQAVEGAADAITRNTPYGGGATATIEQGAEINYARQHTTHDNERPDQLDVINNGVVLGEGGGVQEGGQYNRQCIDRSSSFLEGLTNAAISTNLKDSWPYSMWRYPADKTFGTWDENGNMTPGIAYTERPTPFSAEGFANWFARIIAANYCFMRGIVKWIMSIFGREDDAARSLINSDTTLMIISWLQLVIIAGISPIITALSTCNLIWNSYWMWTYRKDPRSKVTVNGASPAPWRMATADGGCCIPPAGPATVPNWKDKNIFEKGFIHIVNFFKCWLLPRAIGGPAKYGIAGILIQFICLAGGVFFSMMFGPLLGMWQTAQYFITFFLYPVFIAPGIIGDIIKCNAEFLTIVYGMAVMSQAYMHLTPTTAGLMGVVWLYYVIKVIWKHIG